MRRPLRHTPLAALAFFAALTAPAAAQSTCTPTSLADQVANAPVIVSATAEPGTTARGGIGLVSPATFRVTRYEKGSGPGTIQVTTALSNVAGTFEGPNQRINPLPGQRWLLLGSFEPGGVFSTTSCLGSHRAFTSILKPQLRSASGRVLGPLRNTVYDPATIPGATVTVRRGGPLVVMTGVGAPVDHRQATLRALAGLRAKVAGIWQPLDVRWQAGPDAQVAARVTKLPARTTALQMLNERGFFAANVRLR